MKELRYSVPKFLLPEMLDRVRKVNERGSRLGASPWEVAGVRESREAVLDEGGYKIGERDMAEVTLRGEPPRIPGWRAVARIAWDPYAGALVRSFGEAAPTPPASPGCDHCGTERSRGTTYLVAADDGRVLQVGSTCVRDFTGLEPAAIDWYADAEDDFEKEWLPGPLDPDTDYLLALASAAVRQYGWLSALRARESGGTATSRRVMDHLDGGGRDSGIAVTEADRQRASEVRRLVLADASGGEYPTNLRAVLVPGTVSLGNAPLAVSAVAMAERIERDARMQEALAAAGPPQPLPVGDGVDLEGVVVGVSPRDGFDGLTWKMTLLGRGWRCWMTAPAALLDAVEDPEDLRGRQVRVRANVTVSDDDASFGFGHRPRSAVLLD